MSTMKKLAAFCLVLIFLQPAGAVQDEEVKYTGGTVRVATAGVLGHFDTTSDAALSFDYPGDKLVIPYAKIESFEYSEQVARHLGVLPAIAVGLIKKRQQKHFVRISYRDAGDISQVAVFEISKKMPRTLMAILQTRAPQGCKRPYATMCGEQY
jgi:hypothetical protein